MRSVLTVHSLFGVLCGEVEFGLFVARNAKPRNAKPRNGGGNAATRQRCNERPTKRVWGLVVVRRSSSVSASGVHVELLVRHRWLTVLVVGHQLFDGLCGFWASGCCVRHRLLFWLLVIDCWSSFVWQPTKCRVSLLTSCCSWL